MRVAGVILAAGEGVRFGGVKQLASFRGRPLVEWSLAALRDADLDALVVVLGAHAHEVEEAASLAGADVVRCDDWAQGQSASLRAGLRAVAAAGADAAVILLGDQPLIACEAVRRVVAEGGADRAVRATYGGQAGHPTLIGRELWPRLSELTGDAGAAGVLRETGFVAVVCDGLGSPADVDTPEALRDLERRPDARSGALVEEG